MAVKKPSKNRNCKSSQDCRDLIDAAVRKAGTYRGAAALLKYQGSVAALHKMRKGQLHDTPEMKLIIIRRKRSARVAFLNFKEKDDESRGQQIGAARIALNQIFKVADDLLLRIDKGH